MKNTIHAENKRSFKIYGPSNLYGLGPKIYGLELKIYGHQRKINGPELKIYGLIFEENIDLKYTVLRV